MNFDVIAQRIAADILSSGVIQQSLAKEFGYPTQSANDKPLSLSLRGDCFSLANAISEKHNIETRIIFGEMKKLTGVSQPEANEQQLSERIVILQRWLETGLVGN
jgi:hypothetical protein